MDPLIKKAPKKQEHNNPLDHFTAEQSGFLSGFGRKEVREAIAGLKHVQTLHYMGRMYNMHDVFADLLKLSGPAKVKIISYSITEFPLRILSQFLEKKIITELDLLLDFTVSRTPSLKQFAMQFANRIKFTDIHSKVLLIENERWTITLLSSANFTRNNRYENGVIFTDKKTYQQYVTWFENIFENAN